MKKLLKNLVFLTVGLFLVGVAVTMGAWVWNDSQTTQTAFYNRGLVAYVLGANDLALKDFDLSYADYNAKVGAVIGMADAPPSLEQAELSREHAALALVKMKQIEPAVLAYKECLRLTSDWYLSKHQVLPGEADPAKIVATAAKIKEDGKDCAINLEILFHQQQQQADQEGKGKGEGQGKGKGKDGDKSSDDPSDSAGKQSRDGVND